MDVLLWQQKHQGRPQQSMVIITKYDLVENPKKGFFVKSREQNFCPCCMGKLKVIGSRRRGFINGVGEKVVLIIRRLFCLNCHQIHHELPDILVPYKRHERESIEAVVTSNKALTIPADESTIRRWRNWFLEFSQYFLGCLESIAIRYGREAVEDNAHLPESMLQKIWHYVGNAPGWLARVVRPIANANLWIHTRFAFLS